MTENTPFPGLGVNWATFESEQGEISIKDIYAAHSKTLGLDSFQNVDIKLSTDCFESYTDWLKEQDVVIGCMYNMWDEDIMNILKTKYAISIVVNGSKYIRKYSKKYEGIRGIGSVIEDRFRGYVRKYPPSIDEMLELQDLAASSEELQELGEKVPSSEAVRKEVEAFVDNKEQFIEVFSELIVEQLKRKIDNIPTVNPIQIFCHESDPLRQGSMHHKFLVGYKFNSNREEVEEKMQEVIRIGEGSNYMEKIFNSKDKDMSIETISKCSIVFGSANMATHSKATRDSIIIIESPLNGDTEGFEKIRHGFLLEHFLMSALSCPVDEYLKDKGASHRSKLKRQHF